MEFPAVSRRRTPPLSGPFRRRTGGFALIEVLVAVVVLSFGLLGMVGMQAFSLQANRDAKVQAQALSLAKELAEMMRGNKGVATKTAVADNPYLGSFTSPLTMAAPSYCLGVANAATGCTTAKDVASAQMTDWLARVDAELPEARVAICFDGAPYDAEGMPQWTCTANSADEIAVIKIGWTRAVTDRSQTGSAAFDRAADTGSRPYVVLPVTGGNSL